MDIVCSYINESSGYKCSIYGLNAPFTSNHLLIGNHVYGMSYYNVKKIEFDTCSNFKIPQGLTRRFPNLQEIHIVDSKLRFLSRADFAEYKNLKFINLAYNEIEFIPGDLFADCPNLEHVSLGDNPLKFVGPSIFDGLEHLKSVYIDKQWIIGNVLKQKISAINNMVNEEFRKMEEPKMRALRDKIQNLEAENQKMKAANQRLKNANQKLKAENHELSDENQDFSDENQKLLDKNQKLNTETQKLGEENQNLNAEIEKHKPIKCFIQSNETLKDLYINIEDRQFHVHKLLIAARSPTIAEILNNNPEAENLNLVNISVDIFEDILKYLYTEQLPENADFKKLFAVTGRLKIKELMDFSARKILEQLNHENALELLNLGNKFGHKRMRTLAFERIKRKYPKIKDEMSEDGEKIEKMIGILKKQKKLEEEMKSLL